MRDLATSVNCMFHTAARPTLHCQLTKRLLKKFSYEFLELSQSQTTVDLARADRVSSAKTKVVGIIALDYTALVALNTLLLGSVLGSSIMEKDRILCKHGSWWHNIEMLAVGNTSTKVAHEEIARYRRPAKIGVLWEHSTLLDYML